MGTVCIFDWHQEAVFLVYMLPDHLASAAVG